MKKRVLFLFGLIFSFCFASPSSAAAGDYFTADGIRYYVYSEEPARVGVTYLNSANYSGDIVIPPTVEYDGKEYTVYAIGSAFYRCPKLTCVSIPSTVCSMSSSAFLDSQSLRAIYVDEASETFKTVDGVLYNKDMTTLLAYPCGRKFNDFEIPGTVTTIGIEAFYNYRGMSSIFIPNNVTKIDYYAFEGCTALKTIVLGMNVERIEDYAFGSCKNLKQIISLSEDAPTAANRTFYEVPKTCVVKVPLGSVTCYSVSDGWNYFTKIQDMTDEEEEYYFVGISAPQDHNNGDKVFDLGGRLVNQGYRGIAVRNGRKLMMK